MTVTVTGNIGTPVEKKVSKSGKPYAEFRIAENYGKDQNKITYWYTVRAFIDEMSQDMLGKGMFVEVKGELKTEKYVDKQGQEQIGRTMLSFSVNPAEFPTKAEGSGTGAAPAPKPQNQSAAAPNYSDIGDDDIPF